MDSIFSASESNLGYLYQTRFGLLLIISELNQDSKLLIEKLDDISIEKPNQLDVYQTKFHINSVANLTDGSPDFWKTLRVWSEQITNNQINPDNCFFNLVTTARASENTIPFLLKVETLNSRDIQQIQVRLKEVITNSLSKSNRSSYEAFSALSDEQQKKLIKNISVLDNSVNINDAKDKITKCLRYSAQPNRIEVLYENLEGWFFGQVILLLQNQIAEITGKAVQTKVLDIADCLKSDNLPADFTDSIASDEELLSPHRRQLFVRQLEIIDINPKLINHAISDYHRAFSQKSKWLREGLILPQDEIEYDKKLIDNWERKFAILDDSSDKDADIKKNEGKLFYVNYYVKTCPDIHFKDRFKEQYMITGSCQILSDKKKIGWHPDYKEII